MVGEGPSRERAARNGLLLLRWRSCRKGSSLCAGAGDEVRESGGRERERRMVTARVVRAARRKRREQARQVKQRCWA